jgi:hypothetical protein
MTEDPIEPPDLALSMFPALVSAAVLIALCFLGLLLYAVKLFYDLGGDLSSLRLIAGPALLLVAALSLTTWLGLSLIAHPRSPARNAEASPAAPRSRRAAPAVARPPRGAAARSPNPPTPPLTPPVTTWLAAPPTTLPPTLLPLDLLHPSTERSLQDIEQIYDFALGPAKPATVRHPS